MRPCISASVRCFWRFSLYFSPGQTLSAFYRSQHAIFWHHKLLSVCPMFNSPTKICLKMLTNPPPLHQSPQCLALALIQFYSPHISAQGFHVWPQATYRPFLHPATIQCLLFQTLVPQVTWLLPISKVFSHHFPPNKPFPFSLSLSKSYRVVQDQMQNPPTPWSIPGLLCLQWLSSESLQFHLLLAVWDKCILCGVTMLLLSFPLFNLFISS